jgi:hypothetical protein
MLRYSDEQTIAAVAAVCRALDVANAGDRGRYDDWGILAAPRFLGRANLVLTLKRFAAEGVWGVSPHLIPHFALHSQAGTLSLVLGTHGPNLGLGGGIHAASEGLLTAFSWLHSGLVPGVWLTFTGWSPEYHPNTEGQPIGPAECFGMALALVPAGSATHGKSQLRLVHGRDTQAASPLDPADLDRRLARDAASSERSLASPPRRLILHEGHAGGSLPRPHLRRQSEAHLSTWVVAVDAAGRRRIELVTF